MKHLARALLAFGLCATAGSGQAAKPAQGCSTSVPVADEATLHRLLRCASAGGEIMLARDAAFPVVAINSVTLRGLTIRSQDPGRPARFTGLVVRNSSGLTLRDIAFLASSDTSAPMRGAKGAPARSVITVVGSTGITLQSLRLTGDTASFRQDIDSAVLVRNARDVTISGLRVEGFRNGIALRDSSGLSVTHNAIRLMQTDGIRASGVEDLHIARNVIASFSPAPRDHPDGVQLWARNPNEASRRVVIEDNLILRGSGRPIQGIFLRAGPNANFREVTIRNNLIVGARWNGIAVQGGDGVAVTGNAILSLDGQVSWLRMEDCVNATASGNSAARYVIAPQVQQAGNSRNGASGSAPAVITQWRERLGLGSERFPE